MRRAIVLPVRKEIVLRPVARMRLLCDDPRMRSYNLSLLCLIALASCASKPVELSANRCWAVSVGDEVEGTAVLFAHAAEHRFPAETAPVSGSQRAITVSIMSMIASYNQRVRMGSATFRSSCSCQAKLFQTALQAGRCYALTVCA